MLAMVNSTCCTTAYDVKHITHQRTETEKYKLNTLASDNNYPTIESMQTPAHAATGPANVRPLVYTFESTAHERDLTLLPVDISLSIRRQSTLHYCPWPITPGDNASSSSAMSGRDRGVRAANRLLAD